MVNLTLCELCLDNSILNSTWILLTIDHLMILYVEMMQSAMNMYKDGKVGKCKV